MQMQMGILKNGWSGCGCGSVLITSQEFSASSPSCDRLQVRPFDTELGAFILLSLVGQDPISASRSPERTTSCTRSIYSIYRETKFLSSGLGGAFSGQSNRFRQEPWRFRKESCRLFKFQGPEVRLHPVQGDHVRGVVNSVWLIWKYCHYF